MQEKEKIHPKIEREREKIFFGERKLCIEMEEIVTNL